MDALVCLTRLETEAEAPAALISPAHDPWFIVHNQRLKNSWIDAEPFHHRLRILLVCRRLGAQTERITPHRERERGCHPTTWQ